MNGVHVVKLRFEFEPQLNLLFMVFSVLHVFFLKLKSHLPLAILFLLEIITESLQGFDVFLELHLILRLLIEFLLKLPLHAVHFLLMFLGNLGNKHAVIGLAAVFKQNREDLPDGSDYRVFTFCVLEALFD